MPLVADVSSVVLFNAFGVLLGSGGEASVRSEANLRATSKHLKRTAASPLHPKHNTKHIKKQKQVCHRLHRKKTKNKKNKDAKNVLAAPQRVCSLRAQNRARKLSWPPWAQKAFNKNNLAVAAPTKH